MLSPEIIARMDKDQRKRLSEQGNRARELIRLGQEREIYLPTKQFQRFVIIGSLEFDEPMVRTALFFNNSHAGRYNMIVGNSGNEYPVGWYNGINKVAELVPPVRAI